MGFYSDESQESTMINIAYFLHCSLQINNYFDLKQNPRKTLKEHVKIPNHLFR